MNQPKPKPKQALQIQVSFEVSRLSPQYLANAYEQILPLVRRATSTTQPSLIDLNLTLHPAGEDHHEYS
jgi:hypothetical protein